MNLKLATFTLWGIAVVIGLLAFSKLERTSEEMQDYIDAELPPQAFVLYSQIDYVYGYWAAEFWKLAVYENNIDKARTLSSKTDIAREQIQRAMNQEFVIPQDHDRDTRIRKRYNRIRDQYADIERRSKLSERHKDFFAYFGGASMVGIAAYIIGKSSKPKSLA